jgi:hypothetical protein
MNIIYHWSVQTFIEDAAQIVDVHRTTVIQFYQQLRTVALKTLNRKMIKLGGNEHVVEIDESLFVKVKHNKGKDLFRP